MSITVGFISPEGFIVSATGDSLGQALSQLEDATGVAAKGRWAQAQDYLQWRDGLDESGTRLPERDTDRGVPGALPPVPEDQDAAEAKEDDQGGSEATRPEQPGGEKGSPELDQVKPERVKGAPCNVCNETVPPALVELSQERFGNTYCRGCGNW